jgi:hypothetical protein
MKKQNKKSAKKKSPSPSKFASIFGGLKKHDLDVEPINVFALKIEHCEETFPPSCPFPMAPAPFMPAPRS